MTLAAAKKLFFEFEGSRFYMSRNDVEAEYLAYGVPKEQEDSWLKELTQQKLKSLSERGNYRVLSFLCNHSLLGFLELILKAAPLGSLCEKCAFLECLLRYAEICHHCGSKDDLIERCRDFSSNHASDLLRSCRSTESRARVQSIIAVAKSRRFN